jgi:hypothetical protein
VRGIALLLIVAGLAGCGSSDNSSPGLTDGQARALVAELEAARAGAAARDLPGTKAAVAKFRASVAHLRRTGALSDPTARSLRIGAARLLQRIESDSAPPPAPEAPATDTTPAPLPAPKKHDEKKPHDKKEHGKGHKGEGGGE